MIEFLVDDLSFSLACNRLIPLLTSLVVESRIDCSIEVASQVLTETMSLSRDPLHFIDQVRTCMMTRRVLSHSRLISPRDGSTVVLAFGRRRRNGGGVGPKRG